MKIHLLLYLLLLPAAITSAQKTNNRMTVNFSDGVQHEMNMAGAIIKEDSTLTIIGTIKGEISNSFQIQLIPDDNTNKKKFTKGYYYFKYGDQLLNFVPGQTISYKAQGYYVQENNNKIFQEWETANDPEKGFIEIETITSDRINGRYYCELIQSFPAKGAKKTAEGTFDLAFSQQTNQKTTASVTQQSSIPAKQSKTKAEYVSQYGPLFGLYDVQFALGAITSAEMGFDVDFGATLINLSYRDLDASTTAELHYSYSKQKFEDLMNDVRSKVYVRIRPFCSSPVSETNTNNLLAMIIGGLYADVGYSGGKYFYTDYLDNRLAPDYSNNGLFWGWGWNLVWRAESRWGVTLGFGSKRYKLQMPDGTEGKYRSRLISLGAVYNLIWKE
jgi:hypothetical protein